VGLGLTLAKALAERMNGCIGFESQIDMGSKVWLELPLDACAQLEDQPSKSDDDQTHSAPKSNHLRALLLADEPLRAAQLRHWLESEGHHCLQSTTLSRASRLLETLEIDALIISHQALEDLWSEAPKDEHALGLDSWLKAALGPKNKNIKIIGYVHDRNQAEALKAHGLKPLIWPQAKSSLMLALTEPQFLIDKKRPQAA